jgi:putative pyruvate formate lyase activating enzyme
LSGSYLKLSAQSLEERVSLAEGLLKDCTLCPRECRVDRTAGDKKGFCRTPDVPVVSSWGAHFGEEAPITGRRGSGTIFFANCNLSCVFCQNWSISRKSQDSPTSNAELALVMLRLEEEGCHNINLVSPSHQVPMILRALLIAKDKGLSIPIVYNTGGYDMVKTLKLLDGIVDIYMPDFKYWDPHVAGRLSGAADYPERARAALLEMHRQTGGLAIENGIAQRGLLVRHLVLPGALSGTREIMNFIAREISKDTYVNIMNQYHPCHKAWKHPPLDRRITPTEYEEAIQSAMRTGLKRIDGVTV